MSRIRLNGFGLPWGAGSVQWEYVQSNKDLARRVVVFLEDRRVLTGNPHRDLEDADFARLSADSIRNFMTAEIFNVKDGGELEAAFKSIRNACKAFVDGAGTHSIKYQNDARYFHAMLTSMRQTVGQELGWLAEDYGIKLTPEVQAIVP